MVSDSNFVNLIIEVIQVEKTPDKSFFDFIAKVSDQSINEELEKCDFYISDALEENKNIHVEEF